MTPTRRAFLAGAGASVIAAPRYALAQQRRLPRIAYLSANPPGDFRSQAFLEGLRDFGYTEGKDIVIDYFLAPTNADLPEWAAKAVASKPDLILEPCRKVLESDESVVILCEAPGVGKGGAGCGPRTTAAWRIARACAIQVT